MVVFKNFPVSVKYSDGEPWSSGRCTNLMDYGRCLEEDILEIRG